MSLSRDLYDAGKEGILQSMEHETHELSEDAGELRTLLAKLNDVRIASGATSPSTAAMGVISDTVRSIEGLAGRLQFLIGQLRTEI